MTTVRRFGELIAWQKAMDLVTVIYKCTADFPREEMFGLTNQLRRAAVSIPSNIAEGQGRKTTREFLHFLSIARGSLQELETQVRPAERLGYMKDQGGGESLHLTTEVGRLIAGLSNSLSSRA